jgi:uncharacterized protein (DUF1778 family)
MRKNHQIRFRVDRDQAEQIRNKASAKGYSSTSAFLRHLALERDMLIEQAILDTRDDVVTLSRMIKESRKTSTV